MANINEIFNKLIMFIITGSIMIGVYEIRNVRDNISELNQTMAVVVVNQNLTKESVIELKGDTKALDGRLRDLERKIK